MCLRKLFFSDYGNVAKLERCTLDGSQRSRIVHTGMEQPTALTLDLVKELVYWADVYLDFIAVVDYDGGNRHTIIRGNSVSKIIYNVQDSMMKILQGNVSHVGSSESQKKKLSSCSHSCSSSWIDVLSESCETSDCTRAVILFF